MIEQSRADEGALVPGPEDTGGTGHPGGAGPARPESPSVPIPAPAHGAPAPASTPAPRRTFLGLRPESRAVSLVWAVPFMVFYVYPIAGAFEYGVGRPLGAALLAVTVASMALYIASWLVNPVAPAGARVTPRFAATAGGLVVLQIAMAGIASAAGGTDVQFMIAFLAAMWSLQAPRRLLFPGAALLLALTIGEALLLPGSGILPPLATVTMTAIFCLLARTSIAHESAERLDHRRALALSREAERSRISADLHDILGQSLTALTVKADLAGRLLDAGRADAARAQIEEITGLSRAALADVRAVVAQTRAMQPSTEIAAARDLLDAAGVRLRVTRSGEPTPGAPSSMAAHAIREGVTNALAHAEPSEVAIELRLDGVRVRNDGYSPRRSQTTAGGGTGLIGLRERVRESGLGDVSWGPVDGRQWMLELRLDDEGRGGADGSH